MIVLPIGHESQSVRRLPWVTFGLMAVCLVVHIIVAANLAKIEKKLVMDIRVMFAFYILHPYLEFDPELQQQLFASDDIKVLLKKKIPGAENIRPPEDEDLLVQQQEMLDDMAEGIKKTIGNSPFNKYGMVSNRKTFPTMISYMFLHGDWLHLLFNLLFLYLMGPFIEDVWGRPIYLFFYLLAGIFAAQMFSMNYPFSSGPLIGASGAISGVMGAFLVRYWRIKIRFFYYVFLFLPPGTFQAPAWLMLPLWLGMELLNARKMDALFAEGGSVAHWAHVWGFVFGLFAGLLIKFFQVEEKLVKPFIDRQTTYLSKGYTLFEEASEALEDNNKEAAYGLFKKAAQENPGASHIVENVWNLGIILGKEDEATPYFLRLIEIEIKQRQMEMALFHFRQLRLRNPQVYLGHQSTILLIEAMMQAGEEPEALELIDRVAETVKGDSPPGLILRFAGAIAMSSAPVAERVMQLVFSHPEIPAAKKDELRTRRAGLPKSQAAESKADRVSNPPTRPAGIPEEPLYEPNAVGLGIAPKAPRPTPPSPPPPPPPRLPEDTFYEPAAVAIESPRKIPRLKATSIVPQALEDDRLVIQVENVGTRTVGYNKIRAISVVKITPAQGRPYLLIDLFLDDPKIGGDEVRTLRVSSMQFDPRSIISGSNDLLSAYRAFSTYIFAASGGGPLPDLDAIKLKNLRSFPSIEAYEQALFT